MEQVKIKLEDREFLVEKDTSIIDFINFYGIQHSSPILGAIVNNESKSLNYKVNEDIELKFIDYNSPVGVEIYRKSLLLLFIKVCEEFYPEANVIVRHSINKGVFCELRNCPVPINEELRKRIDERMRELVNDKVPFIRRKVTKEEAKEIFTKLNQQDKIGVIDSLNRDTVTIYSCGDWSDYFYGYLVPNSSFLTMFELRLYEGGFIVRYPQKGDFYHLPPYSDQKKLFEIFKEFKKWNEILGVENVTMLNKIIKQGRIREYMMIAEALQEKKYAKIADMIKENPDKKIVLIAGPSSSGKTTSSYRLTVQLMVNGIKAIPIALDDYFVNRDRTPIGEDGKPDFESLYAVDLDLFNQHLKMLLNGEEVELPIFDFKVGMRKVGGRKLKLEENQVLIFEGIHALNEELTRDIPQENKFKIYISALTSLSIDDHNSISTSDSRLLRRMVRDYKYRGHSPERTLELWDAVRRGEDKNIFPYQENADVVFNSAMFYEISVLRPIVEPLLEEIKPDSNFYPKAKAMLNFIRYFEPVPSEGVPENSIIREFIGGSCFQPEE